MKQQTPKMQSLSIDLLKFDGGTQSRLSINEEVVDSYAEIIEAGVQWPFPPIDVFTDGTEYWPADGFHRGLAAVRAKRGSIPCNVHPGTVTDAKIFGMTANDQHGLRMTRADKRACVEWLLDNGGRMSRQEVASKAGVSLRTVAGIIADRKPSAMPKNPPKATKKSANCTDTDTGVQNETPPDSGADRVETIPTSPPPASPTVNVPTPLDDDACDGSGGGGEPDLDGEWLDEKPEPEEKPKPGVKALEGREAEAFDARKRLTGMYKTIAQWFVPIDEIRNSFPGKVGDRVQKQMDAVYQSLQEWEKGIK